MCCCVGGCGPGQLFGYDSVLCFWFAASSPLGNDEWSCLCNCSIGTGHTLSSLADIVAGQFAGDSGRLVCQAGFVVNGSVTVRGRTGRFRARASMATLSRPDTLQFR
jgi:hypothetical protein